MLIIYLALLKDEIGNMTNSTKTSHLLNIPFDDIVHIMCT